MNTQSRIMRMRRSLHLLPLAILLLATGMLTGCELVEPIHPAGYSIGLRVESPFETMVANAHPEPVTLKPVCFAFDSAELTEEAQTSLRETAARILKEGRPVVVSGHTDSVNTEAHNRPLGMERAIAVRDYLWEAGVPKNSMFVRSRGKLDPATSNLESGGPTLNRRVEITLQPVGPGVSGSEGLRILESQRAPGASTDQAAGSELDAALDSFTGGEGEE